MVPVPHFICANVVKREVPRRFLGYPIVPVKKRGCQRCWLTEFHCLLGADLKGVRFVLEAVTVPVMLSAAKNDRRAGSGTCLLVKLANSETLPDACCTASAVQCV